MIRIPLELIEDNPFQTRTEYGDMTKFATGIFEMRKSLPETSGLIHVPPARLLNAAGDVLVPRLIADFPANDQGRGDFNAAILEYLSHTPGARVQIAAGHRRFRAFKYLTIRDAAAFNTFPVDLRALSDEAMADIAQEENAKRKDLSPVEEAVLYERVIAEFGWTQAEVGERWGLTQSAVSNKLRLLKLPREIQALLRQGAITERHGRALLRLVSFEERYDIYLEMLGSSYKGYRTVAEVEAMVDRRITDYTYALDDAEWGAEYTLDGEWPMCNDCSHRVQVGREWRCNDFKCYHAKKKAWRHCEVGPAKAREFYEMRGAGGWQFHPKPHLVASIPCAGCDRPPSQFSGDGAWLVLTVTAVICPECAQRAGLQAAPPVTAVVPEKVLADPPGHSWSRDTWTARDNGDGGNGNGQDPDHHAEAESEGAGEAAPVIYTVNRARVAPNNARPPEPASKIYITIRPGDGDFLQRPVDIEAQYVSGGGYVRRSGALGNLGDVLSDVVREHFGEQLVVAYAE